MGFATLHWHVAVDVCPVVRTVPWQHNEPGTALGCGDGGMGMVTGGEAAVMGLACHPSPT